MLIAIAAASAAALIAGRRGKPKTAAAAMAIASMAGVSLWIGVLRPGLAARRTFRPFARAIRQAAGGEPVFTVDGPEYEIAYYYGAPIEPLVGPPATAQGGGKPRLVLLFDDQLKNYPPAQTAEKVLISRPSPEGRRLVLLKIGGDRFEPHR
jgi:hypothetical protein